MGYCIKLDRNTELARAVDVMMARAKGIYIFIIKVNKLFFFFSSRSFLKEIENMFCLFLSSYKTTRESLRDSKKLWKHSPAARVPTPFLVLPKLPFVFLLNNYIMSSRGQQTCKPKHISRYMPLWI